MAKEKACKNCKTIFEGAKCPKCESAEGVDTFKGKINVLQPEHSEVAEQLDIKEKGSFAIKLR